MHREICLKIEIGTNKSSEGSKETKLLKVFIQRRRGENLKELLRHRSNRKSCGVRSNLTGA
jgi:hypothetical protein